MKKITYLRVTDTGILFFFTDSILNNEDTEVMNQNYMQFLSLLICVVLI